MRPAGWLLLALLVFSTSTAFVRQAWAVQSFNAGILILFAAIGASSRKLEFRRLVLFLLALTGLLQLVLARTVAPSETREAILHWAAMAGVFYVASHLGRDRDARLAFLRWYLGFAVALAALCLLQLFTTQGRVLWTFETGYTDVYGTFPSHNNYAQFVELALPVALWFVHHERRNALGFALAGGVLYASAIGSMSRTGTFLCTVELLVFVLIGILQLRRRPLAGDNFGTREAVLAVVPLAAIALTLVVGWGRVWERFQHGDSLLVRRELIEAALQIVRIHPVLGCGLGGFTSVSAAYATQDSPFYANHVHNDWLEFAAVGGIPFALLILFVFLARVRAMFRHPWALGLLAVMLHAGVDYPFPRPSVAGWIFALLGLLYAAEYTRASLSGSPDQSRHSWPF